jgi:hypothetical protein
MKIYVIILLMLLNSAKLISQNQLGEIEIKRSGKYFWGQAYNTDSNIAKVDARNNLMDQISAQISNSTILNTNSDLMVKSIKYIYKPVEELIKVIAYVTKVDVTNIIKTSQPLIIRELKYTEAKTNTNNKRPSDEPNFQPENKTVVNKAESISKENITSPQIENTLIDQLIACNNGDQLRRLLKKEEDKNTLIFNWDSKTYRKTVSSENFYIVLIDPKDNIIIAFLDKGESERKDLKNGQRIINIGAEYLNMIQIWIQLM